MSNDYDKDAEHVLALLGALVKTFILTVAGVAVFYFLLTGGLYSLIYLLFD